MASTWEFVENVCLLQADVASRRLLEEVTFGMLSQKRLKYFMLTCKLIYLARRLEGSTGKKVQSEVGQDAVNLAPATQSRQGAMCRGEGW